MLKPIINFFKSVFISNHVNLNHKQPYSKETLEVILELCRIVKIKKLDVDAFFNRSVTEVKWTADQRIAFYDYLVEKGLKNNVNFTKHFTDNTYVLRYKKNREDVAKTFIKLYGFDVK